MVQQRLRGVAAVEHLATEELIVLEAAATQAAVRGAERESLVLQRMASTLELNRQQQLLEEVHAAEQVRVAGSGPSHVHHLVVWCRFS